MRAYNSLKRNNIVKVGQVLQLQDEDLLRMRNFGKKSLDEMKERLRMRGFLPPLRTTATDYAESADVDLDDDDDDDDEEELSMCSHRIDGRKLGRKTGPRMSLYRNLIVSVLRYEQIRTTEARAKEVRGQVEQIDHARQAGHARLAPAHRRRAARRAARHRQADQRHRSLAMGTAARDTPGS